MPLLLYHVPKDQNLATCDIDFVCIALLIKMEKKTNILSFLGRNGLLIGNMLVFKWHDRDGSS